MTPKAVQQGMEIPEMRGFVAELNGKVVGFALLHESSVRAVYVHPDFQKKGIGSKLLAILEEASSKGIHSIYNLNPLLTHVHFMNLTVIM